MLRDWIKTERKRRGWSQDELARRAGITQGAVSHIEQGRRGEPTYETLKALARVFAYDTVDEMFVAAGLAGAQPPDELDALLERLRQLGYSPHKLKAIEQGVVDFPPEERAALIEDLRAEIRAMEAAQARDPEIRDPPAAQEPGAHSGPPRRRTRRALLARVGAARLSGNEPGVINACE